MENFNRHALATAVIDDLDITYINKPNISIVGAYNDIIIVNLEWTDRNEWFHEKRFEIPVTEFDDYL